MTAFVFSKSRFACISAHVARKVKASRAFLFGAAMFNAETLDAISILFRYCARSAWLLSMSFNDVADFFSVQPESTT
ncbi:hypothetical protein GCT13_13325 [Paraburkholderia sp. CNPSo 3157]|uniref:Uncharacterized protein n=1 Tax=Paraburkholderia franconis TaxID=2654983 RepID=A0A7X1TG34_9BURK|nr:hypothetical protein [Paraburkholderia franconis]MPW17891.1 hypothetical protein [Paraburkholderia franconis]